MSDQVSRTYWTTDRIMRLILGLALAVAIILLLNYLRDVLLPFFVACFISYLLQPLVEFNRRLTHEKGRTLSSILTVIDVAMVITVIIYLFMPSVISELDTLGNILKDVSAGKHKLPPYLVAVLDFIDRYFDPDNLAALLNGSHLETLLSKGSSLLEESIGVIIKVLSWLLTLVYILFILIDYPQISRGFKLIIPHKYRPELLPVVRDVENSMNHYFRGQGLVAMIAAVLYCIGFSIGTTVRDGR